MEGLEISEQQFADINLGDRADSEYYRKENLRIARLLDHSSHAKLSSLCKLTASAFYPAATHLYEIGDMPFLRCVDVVNYPTISHQQDETFIRVPTKFAEDSKGIHFLSKGDICLTKVGTPCFASIVHEHERIAMSRTVMGLSKIHDVDPYYLTAFLRSHHGFTQLYREREQTIQFQLTLDRVADINVFLPSKAFQKRIRNVFLSAYAATTKSQTLQTQAEQTLLSALGLEDWQPPNPLTYTAKASEAFTSNRLDSEFFSSKYDEALQLLKDNGAVRFEPFELFLSEITNGHTPLRHDLSIGEVTFLCSEHVADFDINLESEKHILKAHHEKELKRTNLRIGDMLLNIKGRVGNGKCPLNR